MRRWLMDETVVETLVVANTSLLILIRAIKCVVNFKIIKQTTQSLTMARWSSKHVAGFHAGKICVVFSG
jgi:hypothetical protein